MRIFNFLAWWLFTFTASLIIASWIVPSDMELVSPDIFIVSLLISFAVSVTIILTTETKGLFPTLAIPSMGICAIVWLFLVLIGIEEPLGGLNRIEKLEVITFCFVGGLGLAALFREAILKKKKKEAPTLSRLIRVTTTSPRTIVRG